MKKQFASLTVAIMLVGLSSLASAQGMDQPMGKGMQKGDMMGQGKMMMKNPMQDMMMKAMMEKTMVATPDGGVIVMAGNKLLKYDQDLNLVKEVEIKIDMESMRKSMMKDCPMMKVPVMGVEDQAPVGEAEEKGEE